MAMGDAIWSPRLYEYSTMIAPEGYEGTFVAVTFVPQYVAAGVVGEFRRQPELQPAQRRIERVEQRVGRWRGPAALSY